MRYHNRDIHRLELLRVSHAIFTVANLYGAKITRFRALKKHRNAVVTRRRCAIRIFGLSTQNGELFIEKVS